MGRSAKYISPSKKVRNLSRLVSFLSQKLKHTFPKMPSLTIAPPSSISIKPEPKKNRMTMTNVQSTSISPKTVYHPAIIRASLSMFLKKPGDLDPEENDKFLLYRNWKFQKGEQVEEDILYNTAGGNTNFLHCDLPT